MAPTYVKKRAKRQKQGRLTENGPERPCIRDPVEKPQCNNRQGRRRKRNCSPCRAFQDERGRANTRHLSRVKRINKRAKRKALLAEIEANKLTLEQAGAALEWQMAEMACWQVQMEEKLKLREMLRTMQPPGAINE